MDRSYEDDDERSCFCSDDKKSICSDYCSDNSYPLVVQGIKAKGTIAPFTQAMAENRPIDNMMVNAIGLGDFPTSLTKKVLEQPKSLKHNTEMTALGRNGKSSNLNGIAVCLACAVPMI